MADDQRIRPTVQGRARLLQAVTAVPQMHAVDAGALGEYAQLLVEQGPAAADRQLPEVTRHLASGCQDCATDLDDLIALAAESDGDAALDAPPRTPASPPALPGQPTASGDARPAPESRELANSRAMEGADTDLFVANLPDPRTMEARADAEAQRRQRLRRWRERLLIAAAVAVVAMGLSLIGLAYLARAPRETPRLDLAPISTPGAAPEQAPPPQSAPVQPSSPLPAPVQTAPAQSAPVLPAQPAAPQPAPTQQPALTKPAPAAPAAPPASSGVAAPSGMDCPPSHPVKGNRSSMIYHLPGGGFYGATRPEQCFAHPSDAEAAGYRRSQR